LCLILSLSRANRLIVGCATSETLVHRRVAEEQGADFRVPHSQAMKRVADRLGVHRTGGINSTSKGVAAVKTAMSSSAFSQVLLADQPLLF
jgi:hypothetical protein